MLTLLVVWVRQCWSNNEKYYLLDSYSYTLGGFLQTNRWFRSNSYDFSDLQEGEIEFFFLRHLQSDPLVLPRLPPPVPLLGLPGQPRPLLGRCLLALRQKFLKRKLRQSEKSRLEVRAHPGSVERVVALTADVVTVLVLVDVLLRQVIAENNNLRSPLPSPPPACSPWLYTGDTPGGNVFCPQQRLPPEGKRTFYRQDTLGLLPTAWTSWDSVRRKMLEWDEKIKLPVWIFSWQNNIRLSVWPLICVDCPARLSCCLELLSQHTRALTKYLNLVKIIIYFLFIY